MEIISYVLDGGLEHRDSMGNGSVIGPGEFQRMSAGTGIRHSEFNASTSVPVHFLQIWILPERRGIAPGYEQRSFDLDSRRNRLRRVVDRDAREGALKINADASLSNAVLEPGVAVDHVVAPQRHAWLQIVRGSVALEVPTGTGPIDLAAGDGAAISHAGPLRITGGSEGAELLVFDLP
jgi:redox-sensitive bicupin YhaK (pirin superfamily)